MRLAAYPFPKPQNSVIITLLTGIDCFLFPGFNSTDRANGENPRIYIMVNKNSKDQESKESAFDQTLEFHLADTKDTNSELRLSPKKKVDPSASIIAEISGDFPKDFGRYQILQILGEGAMGMVYRAKDTILDRQVALKIPKLTESNSKTFVKRFYREAQAAAPLNNPNICSVFDVGQIDGQHYIAMDYVQGHPLSNYIESDKATSQKTCATIIRKIAIALEEAHQLGIIHRDIKPANIMINQRNEPIVMDFGLALRDSNEFDSRITHAGTLIGSPAYMSPEQVSGKAEELGHLTDVYSLGVVLFELVSGELPFKGRGTMMSLFSDILTAPAPKLDSVRKDADLKLVEICDKAIQKIPEKRFSSMKEFSDALGNYINSLSKDSKSNSSDLKVARVHEKISMIRSLCAEKQYSAAVTILDSIVFGKNNEQQHVHWAKNELPKIKILAEKDKEKTDFQNDPLGLGSATLESPAMHPSFNRNLLLSKAKRKSFIRKAIDVTPVWLRNTLGIAAAIVVLALLANAIFDPFGRAGDLSPNTNPSTNLNQGQAAQRPKTNQEPAASQTNSPKSSSQPQGSKANDPASKDADENLSQPKTTENKDSKNEVAGSDNQPPEFSENNQQPPPFFGPPGNRPPPGKGRDSDFFLRSFDADQNGKLSKAESPRHIRNQFIELDTDKDGQLDRIELSRLDRSNSKKRNRNN